MAIEADNQDEMARRGKKVLAELDLARAHVTDPGVAFNHTR